MRILLVCALFVFLFCGGGRAKKPTTKPEATIATPTITSATTTPYSNGIQLQCEPHPEKVKFFHLQDKSADMSGFITALSGTPLTSLESWADAKFLQYAQSLVTFTDEDDCWNMLKPFTESSLVPSYGTIVTSANSAITRDVLDALYLAEIQDWNTPVPGGLKIIFVYTNKMPVEPPLAGRPPFNKLIPNYTCDRQLPTVNTVVHQLKTGNIKVAFLVPDNLIGAYQTMFSGLGNRYTVVPRGTDEMSILKGGYEAALNHLYCGVEPPTTKPEATVEPPTIKPEVTGVVTIVPPTTTSPPSCPEKTVLQLLHLQDVSWSYTNDLVHLKAKMPTLLLDLKNKFFERRVALGTFVDKPSGNTGYPGDYCYREDSVFSTDETLFTNALNAAKIKSGRDWAESQFDAIYDGVKSSTLGWMPGDMTGDGKHILRVVMVATDVGPHFAGDHSELPATHPDGCHFADYPTKAAITQVLSDYKVYPIIVVTNDMYPYWKRIMKSITSNAKVIPLAAPIDQIIVAIEEALDDICNAAF